MEGVIGNVGLGRHDPWRDRNILGLDGSAVCTVAVMIPGAYALKNQYAAPLLTSEFALGTRAGAR